MTLDVQVRFVCKENRLESLISELGVHKLDLIIAMVRVPPHLGVRVFNQRFWVNVVRLLWQHPNLVEQGKADCPGA